MNASSSPARRRSTSARSSDNANSAGSFTAQEPSRSLLGQEVVRLPDEFGDVEHDLESVAVRPGPDLAGHRADDVVEPAVALVVAASA